MLHDLNAKTESKILDLELLLAKKTEDLKSVTTELERTQKSLRLLNNSSSKLDHLITTNKSFGDHRGVGYKCASSSFKIVLVKSNLLDDSINVIVKKLVVKSVATKQSITTGKFVNDVR